MRWILPACCSGVDDSAESGEEVRSRPKDVTPKDDAKWNFPERLTLAQSRSHASIIAVLDATKREDKWRERLAPSEVSTNLLGLLTHSLNTLLMPFVDGVELNIGRPDHTAPSWETACVGDVLKALRSGSKTAKKSEWHATRGALGFLLEMIAALWNRRCTAKETIPSESFESVAVNRLISTLQIVWFRQVSHNTMEECQNRWKEWEMIKSELHTRDDCIAVVMNYASKATLLHLLTTAKFGEGKLGFTIRRSSGFVDALSQTTEAGILGQLSAENVTCGKSIKIFPSFVDDALAASSGGAPGNGEGLAVVIKEGGEGHGPRREFFECVGQAMGAPPKTGAEGGTHPFLYNRTAGAYWLNANAEDNQGYVDAFRFTGWLLGQSIHNRCCVGINLPELLFQRLIVGDEFSASLGVLEKFDEDAAQAIKNAMQLNESKFKELLKLEGLQTSLTREQYGKHTAEELLIEKTAWQMAALSEGFFAAIGKVALQLTKVMPADLQKMICGGDFPVDRNFDIQKAFKTLVDVETSDTPMAECLWKILDSWNADMKRGFLKFVTGSANLPLPGTELLRIEMPFVALTPTERQAQLGMLPQSLTCANTLQLPNYWEALLLKEGAQTSKTSTKNSHIQEQLMKIMEERLLVAVTSCAGYDLDELSISQPGEATIPYMISEVLNVTPPPMHSVHPIPKANNSAGKEHFGDIDIADRMSQRVESIGFNSSTTTIKEIDQMLAEMDADPNFI